MKILTDKAYVKPNNIPHWLFLRSCTLKISMYKTYSIYWGNDICGGCAIISNTAIFCVTISLGCDFSELSIFPVMIEIVKSNMD